jgi:2-polyprenyl-6-methoxyphenol hydroxylase-like FAD-dependent oxidoreductase
VTGGSDVDVDVAIVGAGPVGLVLAILLGQLGRSVEVLEQWPSPYPLPRAVHFDHEVGRILQSCGIGEVLRDLAEPADSYEWRNATGTTLLRFGRAGAAKSGWPFSSMFCQPELEALLRDRAASLPTVEVRYGVRVDDLVQHHDHVEVGDRTARYLVGCDGANSTVRSLLDIGVEDRGFHYDWLIVDLRLHEPRSFDPPNLQICDPARPTTAVSGGPGRRRWEFMRLPGERLEDLNDAARAWQLLAPWDVHPGNATLERHAVYTFQARVAERWQVERAFLAGDAAHQMPPFAGQGMCAGIRDAANLAWKLDLVLDGRATPDLLATYDEERRPSASAAVDFSIELGKVICVADPAEAAARDQAMADGYDGTAGDAPDPPGIPSGLIADGSPHRGELFPQLLVDGRWLDDVHGAGWRLVTADPAAGSIDEARGSWFTSLGGAVVVVDGATWFDAHGARWALQRPDFHLFGTATDAAGAAALLDDLQRRLTP